MAKTQAAHYEHVRSYVMDRIRQERTQRGLRQAELAERAGVSEKWISKLETQGENLSLKSLSAIAWALGVEVGDLVPSSATGAESSLVRQAKRYIEAAPPKTLRLILRLLRAVYDWQGS